MLGYLRMEQYHHLLREMQWRSTGIVREGEEERRYRKRRGRRKKKRRMIEEYRNALETGNLQSSGTARAHLKHEAPEAFIRLKANAKMVQDGRERRV